jgi:hypothetical protein
MSSRRNARESSCGTTSRSSSPPRSRVCEVVRYLPLAGAHRHLHASAHPSEK